MSRVVQSKHLKKEPTPIELSDSLYIDHHGHFYALLHPLHAPVAIVGTGLIRLAVDMYYVKIDRIMQSNLHVNKEGVIDLL